MAGLSLRMLLQLQTNQFKKEIKGIQKQLQGFGNFVKSAFALGSITAFGKKMVEVGADFENAMAKVQAVTNASTKEFQMMQAEAQRMGATTKYSATEAANALENLTRNGLSAAQATKALSGVLQLAQANAIELSQAADILTNTLNMFGLSVDNAERVNNVLSSAAAKAATNVSELYEALVNAAPAANTLGISLEETVAAIGALANVGTKGANAGTALRTAFAKLVDANIIKKMKEFGIEINETTIRTEGLTGTLKKLKDANLGLTDLVTIFSQRGAVGIQQLISAYDDYSIALEKVRNSAGTTARMFEQGIGNTKKNLEELKSTYEGLLITISQKTGGIVNGVISIIKDLLNNFKSVGGTIANIASIAVPALAGSFTKLIRSIKTATTSIAALKASLGGIVTIIATAVTWIGTALVTAWNKANGAMREANKQEKIAQAEMARTTSRTDSLIKKLGPNTNPSSLAGVIIDLCRLFPEFSETIRKAGEEAARTGNWDRLKATLSDIAKLQDSIVRGNIMSQKKDAAVVGLTEMFFKPGSSMRINFEDANPNNYLEKLDNELKRSDIYGSKEARREIYKNISDIIISAGRNFGGAVEELKKYLGLIFDDGRDTTRYAEDLAKVGWQNKFGEIGIDATDTYDRAKINEAIRRHNVYVDEFYADYEKLQNAFEKQKIGLSPAKLKELTDAYNREMNELLFNTYEKLIEQQRILTSYNQRIYSESDYYHNKKTGDDRSSIFDADLITAINMNSDIIKRFKNIFGIDKIIQDRIFNLSDDIEEELNESDLTKAIEKYGKDAEALSNRLKENTLTQEEYDEELQDLTNDTWEAITALSNFRDELKGLPRSMQDVVSDIEGRYKKRVKEDIVETDDALKEQQANLGKYGIPGKVGRDTQFDYIKSKLQIQRDDLNYLKEYRGEIEKLVDDLSKGLESGNFDLIKGDAEAQLLKLQKLLKMISTETNNAEHKLILAEQIDSLNSVINNMNNSWDTLEKVAEGFDRIASALQNYKNVMNDVDSSDFEKFVAMLNMLVQEFQVLGSVIEAFSDMQDKATKKMLLNNAMEIASTKGVTNAKLAETSAQASAAIASGTAAGARTGWPALLAAIPTAVGAVTAGLSLIGKFANGGIVGGSSYSGDKLLAGVNSREMVLTTGQQKTLFDIANGKINSGGSQQVEFKLRGDELIGVINNYNLKHKGRI